MKLRSRNLLSIGLVVAILVSAMALVAVRQLNRLSFYEVRNLERQRDELTIEWRQLMAEYSTWRLEHNIENEVRGDHHMEPPQSERIQTIRLSLVDEEQSQ